MADQSLPVALQEILLAAEREPEAVFAELLPVLGEVLQCDRCFLYLRNPQTTMGKITHCWRRSPQYPDMTDADWKPEPTSLSSEDPLFAAALRAEASVYVEDVETASSAVVNRAFEQQNFGHRALIHAHLRKEGCLWGILQPCIFGQPRVWTEDDHRVMTQVEKYLTPLAIAYVKAKCI